VFSREQQHTHLLALGTVIMLFAMYCSIDWTGAWQQVSVHCGQVLGTPVAHGAFCFVGASTLFFDLDCMLVVGFWGAA
jgi:hypothetical protein